MKITEIILSILFAFGLLLRFMQLSGSSALIVISLTIISYYYYIFGFAIFNDIKIKNIFLKKSYNNKSPLKIILSVFLGMSVALITNGVLFKLQNWKINTNLTLMGIISALIVLALYYFILKKEINNWKTVYLRSIIIIFLGVYFIF